MGSQLQQRKAQLEMQTVGVIVAVIAAAAFLSIFISLANGW